MTERRPATLDDVAARVGVSPKTVSRVVRDEGGFSERTRQRVLAAIEELGYRPNVHARGLVSGRSPTVGIVVPLYSHPFFPEMIDSAQRTARAEGLTVLTAMTDEDFDVQQEVLTSLEAYGPEGIVIFPHRGPYPHDGVEQLRPFLDRGLKLVVIADLIDHVNAVSISFDLAGGTRQAVEHLVQRGCRKVAMIAWSRLEERYHAYLESLPRSMAPTIVHADDANSPESGRRAMAELLDDHPDVDGVFCFNDLLAVGALQGAGDTGRSVPDDVAVIGFDDITLGATSTPTLTTLRIDRTRLGIEAVQRVLALSRGGSIVDAVLPVSLVQRESA